MGPGFLRQLKGTFVEIRKEGGGCAKRTQCKGRGFAPALALVWQAFGPPNAAAPRRLSIVRSGMGSAKEKPFMAHPP